jgi:hypothetical protein
MLFSVNMVDLTIGTRIVDQNNNVLYRSQHFYVEVSFKKNDINEWC